MTGSPTLFDEANLNRPLPADTDVTVPSVLKWTGSKRKLAPSIYELFPDFHRYYEPFLGGGALLYLAGHSGAIAGDVYEPLVDFFRMVRDQPESVADHYKANWEQLQEDLPDHYYRVRKRFNQAPNPLDLSFLMRTCVNGIVRFNQAGKFNNSFHLSRPGMQPSTFGEAVGKWHRRLQGVELYCQDYKQTVSEAGEGDLVYLDPPYAETKQRYTEELQIAELFEVLEKLNQRGVHWALSFDGSRGAESLVQDIPEHLYETHVFVAAGKSPVSRVLGGELLEVYESLYLNYEVPSGSSS